MKLWLVVTFLGKVGAVAGPLPYDIDECHQRVSDMRAEWEANWETKHLADNPEMMLDGKKLKLTDVQAHCIEQDTSPVMGDFSP